MVEFHRFTEQIASAADRMRAAVIGRHASRTFAITFAFWVTCCLLTCVPILGDRPLIDISAGMGVCISTLMDATGLVHFLSDDALQIIQPGQTLFVDTTTTIALLLAATFLISLFQAIIGQLSDHQLTTRLVGAVMAVLLANVLHVYCAGLVFAKVGVDLTIGFTGLLGSLQRAAVVGVLFYAQMQGFNWISREWTYRRTLKGVDETEKLPVRMDQQGRGHAMLVAASYLGVILLAMYGCGITQETLITCYRRTAKRGLADRDVATAKVAIDRLLQLDTAAPAHQILQARFLESQGDFDAAEKIVQQIVDSTGRQYAPAHQWLARFIGRNKSSVEDPEAPDTASHVSQLATATELDPSDVNSHVALAEAYLVRHSPVQAIRELERAARTRPDLRLTLARLLVIVGQPAKGRQHAERNRDYYQEQVNVYPLKRESRLRLTASLIFLEEFHKAVDVLTNGWELTDDASYHQALGTTYLIWHDTAARSGATPALLLDLLAKSLKYTPDDVQALQRVTVMATAEDRNGPAIDLLTRALKDRQIPASVHCVLGTNAFRCGRVENALRHLEEAYRLDPGHLETLNNLAWVLAHRDPPQLIRALKLANDAVKLSPNTASPRETRGQILAKLGQWSRAVADLENAMQVMRNNPAIHATLADAYEELGDESLAAEHRRLAGVDREQH